MMVSREHILRSWSNQVNIVKVFPNRLLLPDQRQTILVRCVKNWKGVDPILWGRTVNKIFAKASPSAKSRAAPAPSNSHSREGICFETASMKGMLHHLTSGDPLQGSQTEKSHTCDKPRHLNLGTGGGCEFLP